MVHCLPGVPILLLYASSSLHPPPHLTPPPAAPPLPAQWSPKLSCCSTLGHPTARDPQGVLPNAGGTSKELVGTQLALIFGKLLIPFKLSHYGILPLRALILRHCL